MIPSLTVDSVNRITTIRTDPGGKGINVSKVIQKLGGNSIATGILVGNTGNAIYGAANVMCSGTQAAEYEANEELMPKVILHKL